MESRRLRLRPKRSATRVALLLTLPLLAICGVIGFYDLFSNFRLYDDEGILMLSSRLFLDGHIPYLEVPWLYGPVHIAVVQLLHDGLNVPISHSAVRFVTLVMWLLMSCAAGLVVYRLSSSVLWSFVAALLVFLFTHSIVNEPGHPQSLITLLIIAAPLILCLHAPGRQSRAWFWVGAAAAVVFHIKANAGVFLVIGIALVLVSQYRPVRFRALLRVGVVAASFVFPYVLMYPLLPDHDCLRFAILASLTVTAISIAMPTLRSEAVDFTSAAPSACIGFLAASAVALLYAAAWGISALDIVSNLLNYAGNQANFYHFFREYSLLQLSLAAASLVLAGLFSRWQNADGRRRISTLGKGCFTLLAGYALVINDPANAHAMAGYAWPWCWLVMLDRSGASSSPARLLLAAVAGFSPLVAYPIPGSQIYFGSVPVLLAAIVCAADVLATLQQRLDSLPGPQRYRGDQIIALMVFTFTLVWLYRQYHDARQQYFAYMPLALPGTELMRIEPNRGRVFRQLVEAVSEADVVVTTFRFSSLHLWRDEAIPAPSGVSLWTLGHASSEVKRSVVEKLQLADHPVIVTRKQDQHAQPKPDILVWVDCHFEADKVIGPYLLKRRREVPESCRDVMPLPLGPGTG